MVISSVSWLLYTLPPWIQHHGWWHHQCPAPCSVPYVYIYKLINDMLDRMLKDRKLCLLFQLFHDRDLSNHCTMNWILSPYCGKDEEIPSKCPRFSIYDKACGVIGCNKSWTQWVTSSLPQYSDYFFPSCLHMYKIRLSILTHWILFPACFALTFCDTLYNLLPELACHTSQGMTTFHSASDLAEFNRIYHHIAEGTMGSHPSVRDLQSMTRLVMAWM